MSLVKPFDYSDAAAEILDEIDIKGLPLTVVLKRLERTVMRYALRMSNGNKAAAAKLLGINRTTLVERLRKIQMEEQSQPLDEDAA